MNRKGAETFLRMLGTGRPGQVRVPLTLRRGTSS